MYIGRNTQNLKNWVAADLEQHAIAIRAPVGANKYDAHRSLGAIFLGFETVFLRPGFIYPKKVSLRDDPQDQIVEIVPYFEPKKPTKCEFSVVFSSK